MRLRDATLSATLWQRASARRIARRQLYFGWRGCLGSQTAFQAHGSRDGVRVGHDLLREHRILDAERLSQLSAGQNIDIWNTDRRLIDPIAATHQRPRSEEHVFPESLAAWHVEPTIAGDVCRIAVRFLWRNENFRSETLRDDVVAQTQLARIAARG